MKVKILFLSLLFVSINYTQNIDDKLRSLYEENKYSELIEKADSVLVTNPNNIVANFLKGRTLVDLNNYVDGKQFLQRAMEIEKNEPSLTAWGLFYLAKIEIASNNREKAREYLGNCIRMNATKNVTNAAKRNAILLGLDEYYKDWSEVETVHFVFLSQPNTQVSDKQNFAKSREAAFDTINSFFKTKIPRKIVFVVWNGDEDPLKIGIKQQGFARPELCCIHSRAFQTIGHEMTHVISYYVGKNLFRTRFINEGVGVTFDQDGGNNKIALAKANKIKEGFTGKIDIKEAWNNPEKYPEWVYYSFAGEFVKRLIKKCGDERFLKLVSNQTYDFAKQIYGDQLQLIINELEKEIN
jgi:tetratricopeptide (TPR) repeat protein